MSFLDLQRLLCATVWTLAMALGAAEREPHIGYIYPAGGRPGTTFQVVIGGMNLNEARAAWVSGSGVQTEILREERQVSPQEQQSLKEKLAKLQENRKQGIRLSPEEEQAALEMRRTLTAFGRRLTNPSLGDFVTLRVVVAPDAAVGPREIRLGSQAGLSNPRIFCIGSFPEYSKKAWRDVPQARFSMDAAIDRAPPPVEIVLPATLNGQIQPGGVDRYRFGARAGQQLVVSVGARDLIPFMADAVPGWFQAAAALYDAQGRHVAYADGYRFRHDPVISYRIPQDGSYLLEVHDSLYRGREDFVYRISVGERPFVCSVFPLGGQVGMQVPVTFQGWNLASNQSTLDLSNRSPGVFQYQVDPCSNAIPFMADTLPEWFESEPNDTPKLAQSVSLAAVINGRIDRPNDWDFFSFDGQAGQQIVAEVYARRLDSPMDSVLRMFDPSGKQIACNDDQEDKADGLSTHHADSYLSITLPTTGRYRVAIGDIQCAGGATHGYRLRLSAPRPDFELRLAPSSLNIQGGASVPVTAFAIRRDGFAGEIALTLKDGPRGFKLSSGVIPACENKLTFTISASPTALVEPVALHLEGRATIHGCEVVRPVVPAEDETQAFVYRHLVPSQELKAITIGRFRPGDEARLLTTIPLAIPANGRTRVLVRLPNAPMIGRVQFELSDPPDGITLKTLSPSEFELQADVEKVKPGQRGNLIVRVSGERRMASNEQPAPAEKRRIPLGALPAIPFEIRQ